ncbi:MAG: ABC transporter permease [Thermodesulfobacteriota bacterium]
MNYPALPSPPKRNAFHSVLSDLSSLTYHFDLILHLCRRNFLLRYKGSLLGVLWSLLVPFSQLLVLVFVFGKILPLQIEGYPAFVFTAILPWNWFSYCLSSAGALFIGNRDLMRIPTFDPMILVVVDVLVNLLLFILFLPILLAILFFYDRTFTSAIAVLPMILGIQTTLIVGLSLIVATLNVFYRDVQYIITVALMLLFYLTPVFYAARNLNDRYQWVFHLNPMAVLIDSYRSILYWGYLPSWIQLAAVAAFSMLLLWGAHRFYRKRLPDMIDLL